MAVHLGQFQRAAAEIADDAIGPVEPADDAERAQLGLALAGNDLDFGAADALGLGDEGLAVLGVAAGGGRDHPQRADLDAVAQMHESGAVASSALSTASAASRPVDCTSRPRPASTFSLKIGVGLRVMPS